VKRAEILERVNVARRKLEAVQRATAGSYAAAVIRDALLGELNPIPAPDADPGRWAWVLPALLGGLVAAAATLGIALASVALAALYVAFACAVLALAGRR